MATGTVTAREPEAKVQTETAATAEAKPLTLKQRFIHLLHEIFQGREEHLGWRQ
ncbi:MAG: hypothetical protein WBE44_22750 [Terriglobales bacterium]|jgi:hypothetical protein